MREMNSLLQVCKQMESFAQLLTLKRNNTASTRRLSEFILASVCDASTMLRIVLYSVEAMGVAQHHDAVS